MPKMIDLIGQRFDRLVVAARAQDRGAGIVVWRCVCDCGETKDVRACHLRSGATRSCGCLVREVSSQLNLKHGHSIGGKLTPEFRTWRGMKARCETPSATDFENYGGRGIKICDEWANDFLAFYAYVGSKPGPEYSIDRVDVDGDYAIGNVRWATKFQQVHNQRPHPRRRRKGEFTHTIESRAKLSAAHKGKVLSFEHRAAISAAGKGRKKPDGFGAKVSAIVKGRKVSTETRAKLSAARTSWWRRKKNGEGVALAA